MCASATAGAPATSPAEAEAIGGLPGALLTAGCCVLVGWVIVRLLRPEKFLLRRVPGRGNHINLLHLIALFLIYQLSVALAHLALAAAMGIEWDPKHPDTGVLLFGTIFGQMVLAGASLALAAMCFRLGVRRGMGLSGRHWLCDAVRAVIAVLAVLPLCVGVLFVTMRFVTERPHVLLQLLPGLGVMWRVVVFLIAAVLGPIAEEVFFRGLVQSCLRRYLHRPWPAVLLASALFAASHTDQPQAIPALFVLGVVLGYNYERTGRLMAPILIHALFNGVMLLEVMLR